MLIKLGDAGWPSRQPRLLDLTMPGLSLSQLRIMTPSGGRLSVFAYVILSGLRMLSMHHVVLAACMDNSSNSRSTCFLSMAAGAAGATPGGYAGAADSYSRSHRAVQSADFFCGIVPGSVLSQLGKAMNLEGAAGLAMKRLSREGLSWVPTAGNLCTLVAFGIALHINHYLTSESCGPSLPRLGKMRPVTSCWCMCACILLSTRVSLLTAAAPALICCTRQSEGQQPCTGLQEAVRSVPARGGGT